MNPIHFGQLLLFFGIETRGVFGRQFPISLARASTAPRQLAPSRTHSDANDENQQANFCVDDKYIVDIVFG